MVDRGGAVTVNFYDKDGKALDHLFIEQQANEAGISLRTGCFCNPGAGELAFGLQNIRYDKSVGAVRVSFGLANNDRDVLRVTGFVRRCAAIRGFALAGSN